MLPDIMMIMEEVIDMTRVKQRSNDLNDTYILYVICKGESKRGFVHASIHTLYTSTSLRNGRRDQHYNGKTHNR